MNFVERIEALLKDNKIAKKTMLKDLSLGINTFTNWKNRGTVPSGDVLDKIADYLDVSVDYLLGNEKSPAEAELSDDEKQLISILRQLDDSAYEKLLDYAKYLLQNQ